MNEYSKHLISIGYRRISNSGFILSRIDRSDWREYMAKSHAPWDMLEGLKWVRCLEKQEGSAEDHYRRCHSKDNLKVTSDTYKEIPGSNFDPVGFIIKKDPTFTKF